jgi:AcrR family transcriptional regulator
MDSRTEARQTRSEATKARILTAALRLFNERGTAAVSTNHIAEEAGLSPGNLYYHFEDKKQIIRALHSAYSELHERRWSLEGADVQSLARLRENLADGMRQAWQYRFFEREILALLRADAQLRSDYRGAYRRRLDEWTTFGEHLVAQGILRKPRQPLQIRDLSLAIWLIAGNWLGFLDATGDELDQAKVARGADLVLVVLDPYLTAKARRLMSAVDPPGDRSRRGGETDGNPAA